MKKLFLFIFVYAISNCGLLIAAERILFFADNTTAKIRKQAVVDMGGIVKDDLPEIHTVIASFPTLHAAPPKSAVSKYLVGSESNKKAMHLDVPSFEGVGMKRYLEKYKVQPVSSISLSDPKPEDLILMQTIPWGVEMVGAPRAWMKKLTGKGVVVAVLDSSIDITHADLKGNIIGSFNAVDSDGDIVTKNNHGTHVAGIIAARNNKIGVVGVAPEAKILAVKAFERKSGAAYGTIAKAILWSVKNKANIISMSFGSAERSKIISKAVEYALKNNVVLVASSGNDCKDTVNFPAAEPGVIAVTSLNKNSKFSLFSNTGLEISFIAPGEDILSAYNNSMYGFETGTSMSAPHIAGLAALAMQAGAKTPRQVYEVLKAAAVKIPDLKREEQGHGMPKASKILFLADEK